MPCYKTFENPDWKEFSEACKALRTLA
jgi:hypothetical protein